MSHDKGSRHASREPTVESTVESTVEPTLRELQESHESTPEAPSEPSPAPMIDPPMTNDSMINDSMTNDAMTNDAAPAAGRSEAQRVGAVLRRKRARQQLRVEGDDGTPSTLSSSRGRERMLRAVERCAKQRQRVHPGRDSVPAGMPVEPPPLQRAARDECVSQAAGEAHGISWVVREHLDPQSCAALPLDQELRSLKGEFEVLDPSTLLYFDLETTGWIDRAQIFMAGYLFWEGEQLVLEQEIAADVAEERFLVESVLRRVAERPHLISFNGSSYDVPLIRRRLRYHSLPSLPAELTHTDLLHPARRSYRRQLANCKLGTLESQVLQQKRDSLDVPGAEAPLRYYDYCQSGRREFLQPIVYHNRVDLTSLALLHQHLSQLLATDEGDPELSAPTANPPS